MITLKEVLIIKKIAEDEKKVLSLIMSGKVKVNDKIIEKPGAKIDPNSDITVIPDLPYVSRGGLKIEGAFKDFNLIAAGKKIIDVGASTGGFTDFFLQNGASNVIAIDVGYGILSWKLRQNPSVIVMERTNIRNIDIKKLPYYADITVADLSFISIKKVFEKIFQVTREEGEILMLVKPQFEAERREVEKKGVIKNTQTHKRVLKDILGFLNNFECRIEGLTFSKIKGAKGNQEFWVYLKKDKALKSKTLANNKKNDNNYDRIINNTIKKAEIFFSQKNLINTK